MLKRLTIIPNKPVIGAGRIRAVLVMSSSCLGGYDMQTPATGSV
jgi:hypothetical protein